jgi:hypothetical protein
MVEERSGRAHGEAVDAVRRGIDAKMLDFAEEASGGWLPRIAFPDEEALLVLEIGEPAGARRKKRPGAVLPRRDPPLLPFPRAIGRRGDQVAAPSALSAGGLVSEPERTESWTQASSRRSASLCVTCFCA